jgi:rare lipoprotein A
MLAIWLGAMLLASTAAVAAETGAEGGAPPPSPGDPGARHFEQEGEASWYGGRRRKEGDADVPTAAHPNLPKGSRAEVTNLENGKSTEVEVNDRGPDQAGRVIDLSEEAAKRLDMKREGVAPVRIEAPPGGEEEKPQR